MATKLKHAGFGEESLCYWLFDNYRLQWAALYTGCTLILTTGMHSQPVQGTITMPKQLLIVTLLSLCLFACSGSNPISTQGAMAPCPESPNCVSSREDGEAMIEAFELTGQALIAWPEISQIVNAMPRTTIVEQSSSYLHAEATSLVFRFVDDLELELRPDGKTVDIRSASRVGHSDMGVNRQRVESLRQTLKEKNIIE